MGTAGFFFFLFSFFISLITSQPTSCISKKGNQHYPSYLQFLPASSCDNLRSFTRCLTFVFLLNVSRLLTQNRVVSCNVDSNPQIELNVIFYPPGCMVRDDTL
jgi:hypothetical protein